MQRRMAEAAHRALICSCTRARAGSALVLEPDLEFDVVLDDLAVLDPGGRLHDLDRAAYGSRESKRAAGDPTTRPVVRAYAVTVASAFTLSKHELQ